MYRVPSNRDTGSMGSASMMFCRKRRYGHMWGPPSVQPVHMASRDILAQRAAAHKRRRGKNVRAIVWRGFACACASHRRQNTAGRWLGRSRAVFGAPGDTPGCAKTAIAQIPIPYGIGTCQARSWLARRALKKNNEDQFHSPPTQCGGRTRPLQGRCAEQAIQSSRRHHRFAKQNGTNTFRRQDVSSRSG